MKKNILIDGTTISMRMDGLSQYTLNIISHLDCSNFNYTLIIRKQECPESYLNEFQKKGIQIETVGISPIGPLRDIQFLIYLLKNGRRFNAAFIPSNQFPVFISLPTIYTVHDLIYEEYPEQLGKFSNFKRMYLHLVVKNGIKKAQTVVAVSEFTKSEIIRIHNVKIEQKIKVIYEGWEHLLRTVRDESFAKPFEKYFLYVGSARGHKNLNSLIEAIQITHKVIPKNQGIVIAGNTNQLSDKQIQKIDDINSNQEVIKLTGWLTDDQLTSYFSNATAFIFPSLSEGFGIPVLEAFYHKVPVLLSNRGSLPEVGGDAAIYFDPTNPSEIAEKISSFIVNDDEVSPPLKHKGSQRLKLFEWKLAAEQIQELLARL